MASYDSGDKGVIDCHVMNRCSIIEYSIKWTLKNAFKFPKDIIVTSSDICPHPNISWNFWFTTTSDLDASPGDPLQVFLSQNCKCPGHVEGSLEISNSDFKVVKTVALNFELSDESAEDLLITRLDPHEHAESDDIHLLFRLKIYGLDRQHFGFKLCPENETEFHHKFYDSLQTDLQSLWKSARFADLTLIVEGRTIPAHKSILCSRSPVFSKMFQHPTDELSTNTIKFDDISFDNLNRFISFLYAVSPDFQDLEDVYSLYHAADKYQVLDLRWACGQALLNKMTPDNACRLLDLADRHNDQKLLDQVCEFITFHFVSVAETDSWKEFLSSNHKLVALVLKRLSSDVPK